ncbi:hypothetical protein, partial [Escherichia coli]|uniref:hypothetical protein n=1 Tax=Escherichia coli TaxID=562 RepID=UPI001EF48336
ADRNRSHWSTSKTPSYTKSVSWQHHRIFIEKRLYIIQCIFHINIFSLNIYGVIEFTCFLQTSCRKLPIIVLLRRVCKIRRRDWHPVILH